MDCNLSPLCVKCQKEPGCFLWSLPPKSVSLLFLKHKLFDKLLLLAKEMLKWIKDIPPAAMMWYGEILMCFCRKKLIL